jgi:hypothetical protein
MSSMQRELLSTFELELGNFSVRSDFGVDRCSRGAREGDDEHDRSAACAAAHIERVACAWLICRETDPGADSSIKIVASDHHPSVEAESCSNARRPRECNAGPGGLMHSPHNSPLSTENCTDFWLPTTCLGAQTGWPRPSMTLSPPNADKPGPRKRWLGARVASSDL